MTIIRRNDWCTTPATGTPSAIPTKLPRRWLHHGASGTSSIATANAYARWHIVGRPPPTWLDVGYSWLIAEGKVLEGRGPGRQGAHTRLDNDSSYGIVVCGDYRTREPSARDIDALVWLLRHGVSQGWWDTPAFTGGHRDAPQASTTCPGNRLHRLIPSINAAAQIEEPDMPLSWAKAAWDKLRARARLDEGTHARGVDRQELAVILDRLGLLDLPNAERQKVLDDFARTILAEDSSGYVGREVVRHLRNHPSSDLSKSEADARYASKGHTHTGTVKLR